MKISRELSEKLAKMTQNAYDNLQHITEVDLSLKMPQPGKWSKKEILGHLIDSAANNHQRFIRTQTASEMAFPVYDQKEWVDVQGYKEARWKDLLEFWRYYNQHLALVISLIPQKFMDRKIIIGNNEPISIENLIAEYIDHLAHHLEQLNA